MTEPEKPTSVARKRASDFHPDLLRLFDEYVHGLTDRRGFLERAARFAAGGVSATALLEALNPRFAEAQQVSPSDSRIDSEWVEVESAQGYGKLRGYLARPKKTAGKLPAGFPASWYWSLDLDCAACVNDPDTLWLLLPHLIVPLLLLTGLVYFLRRRPAPAALQVS